MSLSIVPISNKIEPFFSNRLLFFKINLFNSLGGFMSLFSVKRLINRIAEVVNKDLTRLYIDLETLKNLIPSLELNEAKTEHPNFEKAIIRFNRLYVKLDKINFLGSVKNKQLTEAILGSLYFSEFTLRKIAYADFISTTAHNTILKDKASTISLNTLSGITNGHFC